MVAVYDNSDNVVAMVEYNSCLDHWDGSNWTCGSTGRHLGITQLADGRYVLIHGTQWQGENDTAEIVSKDEALQVILKNDIDELRKFPELEKLSKKVLIEEK